MPAMDETEDLERRLRDGDSVRDALDHIMRVARQGISPTKRLDWIEIRARYALEGKSWSPDIRETPRDSVKKMDKDFAECRTALASARGRVAELEKALNKIAAWPEGELVTSRFYEPSAARIARAALAPAAASGGPRDR